MSYHTHIPEYIPKYTWSGLVEPMWAVIRWCTRRSDLTLVTSAAMKVRARPAHGCWFLRDRAGLFAGCGLGYRIGSAGSVK